MHTPEPAELATAQAGDITEEQAVEILRAADPGCYGIAISRRAYRYKNDEAPSLQWGVIATNADDEQFDAQQLPSLAEAAARCAEKLCQPASVKAALLRAQADMLIAQAERIEAGA